MPLGQMVTPWVLVAAFVGSRAPAMRAAGPWGFLSLTLATISYYAIAAVDRGLTTLKYFIIWMVLSLIAGWLFGAIGWQTKLGSAKWRISGAAALASVPIAESIVLLAHNHAQGAVATYATSATVGLLLPFAVLGDLAWKSRFIATGAALLISAPIAAVFDFAFHRLGVLGV